MTEQAADCLARRNQTVHPELTRRDMRVRVSPCQRVACLQSGFTAPSDRAPRCLEQSMYRWQGNRRTFGSSATAQTGDGRLAPAPPVLGLGRYVIWCLLPLCAPSHSGTLAVRLPGHWPLDRLFY